MIYTYVLKSTKSLYEGRNNFTARGKYYAQISALYLRDVVELCVVYKKVKI